MSLAVQNLSVTPFGAKAPVLNGITFSLSQGERALLLGPSGAGKSTLMLAASGVLDNLETAAVTGQITAVPSGLLLQNFNDAVLSETVFRDVAFGAESSGVTRLTMSQLIKGALHSVGLPPDNFAERNPDTLSGGELQRACLAGLVTLAPQLLLLDEPTSQLDEDSAAEVRAAVSNYLEASGATALIAEHHFEQWLPLVTRVLILNAEGQLVSDASWDALNEEQIAGLAAAGLWLPGGDKPDLGPITSLTVLTGVSGSGKSTQLKTELNAALAAGLKTGWLPQNPALALSGNTVLECLIGPADRQVASAEDALQLLTALGLLELSGQNPHELSGGEQRRLALGVALIGQPQLLLLDEPTVGLDVKAWRQVVALIQAAAASGAQIMIATHDPNLIPLGSTELSFGVEGKASAPPVVPPKHFSALAMLAASTIALISALFFTSLVSAAAGAALQLAFLMVAASTTKQLRRPKLLIPLAIGAASVCFSNWWLSDGHRWDVAGLVALRVLYFGLPGLLFAAAVKPSQLGDQLTQILHLPARPVVAATVGLNRVHRLASTWQTLVLVRKIRGITQRQPKELATLTLLSLINATRSAQTTAIAMESRGFSNGTKRTWAVAAKWGKWDWLLLAAQVSISALALSLR